MPKQITSQSITLSASGGTIALDVTSPTELYILNGTVTLLSNITIDADISNGAPYTGLQYEFLYQADVDITTNNTHFFVFGTELTQKQCQTQSTITATYNGSGWDVRIMPDFEETDFITASMLDLESKKYVVTAELSWEANEQAMNKIWIPHAFKLNQVLCSTNKTFAGTDSATVEVYVNLVAVTESSSIVIPASTAVNQSYANVITDTNTSVSTNGGYIMLITSKTTPGGKAIASCIIERI